MKKLNKQQRTKLRDHLLIITLLVQLLILTNQITTLSLQARQSFQTSIIETENQENLQIHLQTSTGRLTPLKSIIKNIKQWTTSYYVEGIARTQATTGLTISLTGSNVANIAYVDYYIEARETNGLGTPYRFIAGNNTELTIGGPAYEPTNQTNIENHLTAMNLNTTTSYTIDYYIYIKAESTGIVSGETLTSEIPYTKFDTITYSHGTPISQTYNVLSSTDDAGILSETWTTNQVRDPYGGNGDIAAVRFQNVTIPQGAIITSAYWSIKASGGGANYMRIEFYVIDEDNTATFSTKTDFNSRNLWPTSNAPEWEETATWTSGVRYYGPNNLAPLIEHLVNREGWTSGNALGIKINGISGPESTPRLPRSWDYSETGSTRLYVTYLSYAMSWYPPPPMKLANLPITIELIAITASISVTALAIKRKKGDKTTENQK